MKAEAVEFAKGNGVAFEIGSPWSGAPGSRIGTVWCRAARRSPGSPGGPTSCASRFRAPEKGFLGDLCERISSYDLVFGRIESANGSGHLFLSALEIPNPELLRRDLDARFAGAVSLERGLGAVSLVGFGIGSRPAALFDAVRVLADAGFQVLDSFTGRESLSFVIDDVGLARRGRRADVAPRLRREPARPSRFPR